MKGIFREGA